MKQKKVISLPTNERKIYRQILAFMNFMLNITPQERNVLAELIRLDREYEALPQDKRGKFILSTDIRKDICKDLQIPDKQFNVVISRLRAKLLFGKPLIGEDNSIHPELLVKPDEEGFKIEINFVNTLIPQSSTNTLSTPSNITKPSIEEPPVTTTTGFSNPGGSDIDASKAPVIEEEVFEFTISTPNE